MKTPPVKILLCALVLPGVLLIAACSGGSSDDKVMARDAGSPASSAVDSPAGGAPEMTAPEPAGSKVVDGMAPDADSAYRAADESEAQTKAVISKGQISLRTKNIDKARFELQKLLDGWDGTIANEQSDADKKGHTDRARLELRVPSTHFDEAMDGLAGLGTLVDRSRTSEDVTTQVIDINARVRSQKLSLARIQALLAKARDINQIIAIETQLSQRQADLDSLEQQQSYLADQTELATIDVYMTTPAKAAADKKDDHSFWSGLKSGWDALGDSTNAVLTTVGAVLPFAAVLGLIGFPAWAAWRRRTPKTAPVA